ncbi:helix-turn-helix transcriptional regulator [Streptococcus gallolyticus]|uniref:helix-turn-helix transcriptional regulator n=1 Tax=Streptococcus gallolyticus TaxID=315405 RepID=UPI0001E0F30F|nr:helix-turn-helix domain-containing protein [Streptococcus gallolyticus]EFM29990.1 DNA-binding helix-turn-helix protein [Streptococcus gallolyticus subsp. gallolyticus TX20005]MCL4890278.1 helix-turn-helix domain-containing protein [Streptococcus gallolyticus]QKI01301.1 helix-turn-helix domain-containing protein [Streptococcus gallolyticus]QWX87373.1 helix-turn-helix domain-containing protein [Streptococcus gallolyticus subsp. gallolyticus TX20005]
MEFRRKSLPSVPLKESIKKFLLKKQIGVARQTVNLIENNKYNPSLDLCIKLAEALQTDLNTLFWENRHL